MTNKIDYSKWQNWCWESDSRYYHLSLTQTLFGEWIITNKWGGKTTHIHGSKKHYCNHTTKPTNEFAVIFAEVHKKRTSRGYALIS